MITKAIYYFSLTGKTAALVEDINQQDFPVIRLNNKDPKQFEFGNEEVIVIGSPTYGRGVPPMYFKQIINELRSLTGRKIGLFGSGNTIYGEDFCGAIDTLEELLKQNNEIIFKYKFEGYPTDKVKNKFYEMLKLD
ncbi:hypothetical protein GRF59_14440 [Paenibacillus sp. HJL G12]|uniref:Flavodoxin-like domain-containing protein n=1 Tax=Paenibacillus dendrobii TaxID=2691084 RepID=A0A7X3IJY3_9BACL|nr:flavodoxin family protein [Paenibacillus dendrobii]MWV44816.1 hypothetical protein [Paenibacillus dendrobii]